MAPRPDATRDAWVGADGDLDGGHDTAVDAAPPAPRDAGPLPCEQEGYFSPNATRVRIMRLGEDGWPNGGLNLDGLSTCAPAGDCGAGIDNQAASLNVQNCGIYPVIAPWGLNGLLDWLIQDSPTPESFLLETRGLVMDGDDSVGSFDLVLQHGLWLPTPDCSGTATQVAGVVRCDYAVDDMFFLPGTCTPVSMLDNARIVDGTLEAGGPGYSIRMVYAVDQFTAGFIIHDARITAQIIQDADGVWLVSGFLGGVLCPWDFATATAAIGGADVSCVLPQLPDPDLEAGCDAATDPDGISSAFYFQGSPARLVGLVHL